MFQDEKIKQNKFTLRFIANEIENDFISEYTVSIKKQLYIFILPGGFLYFSFIVLDYYLMGTIHPVFLSIRTLVLVTSVVVLVYLVCGGRWIFEFMFVGVSIAAIGLFILSWLLGQKDESLGHLYYQGLMMLILYSTAGVRIRFVHSLCMGALIAFSVTITALFVDYGSISIFLSSTIMLVITALIGVNCSYWFELYARNDFKFRRTSIGSTKFHSTGKNLADPKAKYFSQKVEESVIEGLKERPKSFNVGKLADMMAMSTRTLQQHFKKYLDAEPREYIRAMRLNLAAQYFSAGHSFDDTAWKWGFDNYYQKGELKKYLDQAANH